MLTLYFNRSFSATSFLIQSLRQHWSHQELHIIISHSQSDPYLAKVADHFEIEPAIEGEAYLEYILEMCKRFKVDVFFPRKNVTYLAHHRDQFESLGIKVAFVTDAQTYVLFDDKLNASYDLRERGFVEIPESALVSNYEKFQAEYERIRKHRLNSQSKSREVVCLKPNTGIGGKGFMRISHGRTEFEDLFRESVHSVAYGRLDRALKSAQPFPQLLLATYLNGLEVSVDCIGYQGQLLAAYPRIYLNKYEQRFDDYPELIEACRRICGAYQLSYLFNVQFKQHHGQWYFIELNTRSAAGAHRVIALGICPLSLTLDLCLHAPHSLQDSMSLSLNIEWGSVVRREESYQRILESSEV